MRTSQPAQHVAIRLSPLNPTDPTIGAALGFELTHTAVADFSTATADLFADG
ncbi:hypothetical protein THAOC_24492, partial [Thalassiosira oceanica]